MEILISLGIIAGILAGLSALLSVTLRGTNSNKLIQDASGLAYDTLSNIRSLSESDWNKLYNLNKGSANTYYYSSSTKSFLSGSESISAEGNVFQRYFYTDNVNREKCGVGNATSTATTSCSAGGVGSSGIDADPSTQKITIIINFKNLPVLSQNFYLSRNRSLIFLQSDWIGGNNQNSFSTTSASTTIVNNKFSSSTNVDYSNYGSVKLNGF